MIGDNENLLLDLYRQYKEGQLANDGGVLNQSYYYIQAMKFIQRWEMKAYEK